MSGGTFKVSRAIWRHPVFAPSPFSEREAFLWLVSEASWKPRTTRAGRHVLDLERGQLAASYRFMADAWGWRKDAVSRFLKRLEKHDMIATESATGVSVITLCNYDEYQAPSDRGATVSATKPATEARQTRDKREEGRKKEKKDNSPPEGFDAFWSTYPRRVGKAKAAEAYARALKRTDPATLLQAVKVFARSCEGQEQRFIPHPTTWLNRDGWLDEAEPKRGPEVGERRKLPDGRVQVFEGFDGWVEEFG